LEVVFTANHLTDTDRQNSTKKYTNYKTLKKNETTQNTAKQNHLVQLPLMTLGQECGITRWAYSMMLTSPHGTA